METYRTLIKPSESEVYKVKGSKFLGLAYPVGTREEIEAVLGDLRAKHAKANHCCYAWKLGMEKPEIRYNDDGEPVNSAGKPIYGQILSYDLTNVLIVVVRYFGGTKLGIGGLIQAYREAARMALEEAHVTEREIKLSFFLDFEYATMDRVMKLIKEKQLEIVSQEMGMNVRLKVLVSKAKAAAFRDQVASLRDVKWSENG